MQISRSYKPHNPVDYYPLINGYADVFMHRNEITEKDEDDNTVYVAEEVYFQVDKSVTKEQVEANFDKMWNNAENPVREPSLDERTKSLEDTILALMME